MITNYEATGFKESQIEKKYAKLRNTGEWRLFDVNSKGYTIRERTLTEAEAIAMLPASCVERCREISGKAFSSVQYT